MKILLLSLLALSANVSAGTPWEQYLNEPSSRNATRVDSIAYNNPPHGGYDSADLEILKLQVLAADSDAYRLAHRLYGQADGGLAEELAAILASAIRPHPEFFLRQVADLDPTCSSFNVQTPGLEYVDRRAAQDYEHRMRRAALASVRDPNLATVLSTCLAKLDAAQ